LTVFWLLVPMTSSSRYAPANALGTDPIISHRTRRQFTVRRRTWTLPPNGFRTSEVTTSADTAVPGLMPKNNTNTGVISAPPPIPVRPITKPTITPARAL